MVANVMYAVVCARKREIAIELAVGVCRHHIVSPFVFESLHYE